MRLAGAHRLVTQLGGVLPRSVAALHGSDDWNPLSGRGVRQVAEVALDELVVTGMTLTSSPPQLDRPVDDYAGVAAELAALGVTGVHRDPEPLQVKGIRPVNAGVLSYERMSFEHDPQLVPALAEEHGGPASAEVVLFRHEDGPRPWLVWVHGAGQGGMSDILVARVGRIHHQLGFNVALPVQPSTARTSETARTIPATLATGSVPG